MRLGILGGTFDPPHLGHYLTAVDAFEHLRLDELVFVPNFRQPFKPPASASPSQRLRMVELMLQWESRFRTDPLEIERNGLSYTVDTLETLRQRRAGAQIFLLAGADVLSSFTQWKDSTRILELATLVVLNRTVDPAVESMGETAQEGALPSGALVVRTRTIDISSTEIRQRVGRGQSIRGFVHDDVADYIKAQSLYNMVTE